MEDSWEYFLGLDFSFEFGKIEIVRMLKMGMFSLWAVSF